jgi:hypothetical protein
MVLFELILASVCHAQAGVRSTDDDQIIRALLPNGNWADTKQLSRFQRADEIRALKKAQVGARDWRVVSLAYLLAILKYDYAANRKIVVDKYESCEHQPYPHAAECWDAVIEPIIGLFRRGDHTFLRPLLKIGVHSDGALSESLGDFYSSILWKQPRLFLGVLSGLPPKTQRVDAMLAATVDGGGMEPKMLRDVRVSLRSITANSDDPLARIARLCLTEVNKANSEAK